MLWYDEHHDEDMQVEDFFERCVRFTEVHSSDEFRSSWRQLTDGETSIPEGSNLRLFRQGVRPIVSDVANTRGGKFSMMFKDEDYINVWHTLASAIVAEELMPANFLTGLVLTVRPSHSSINVWVNSATSYDNIDYMKCQLKLLLDVRRITFVKHGSVRTMNPFETVDPLWNKRVEEFQSLKEQGTVRRGPRSCRSKLTPLEDPFLRTPVHVPEEAVADSSGSSTDDSCDKRLKQIGIAPQRKHGRSRKRGTGRKDKLLGNAEYEKALSMMSHTNGPDPAATTNVLMSFITVWTRFWLFVTNITDGLQNQPPSDTKKQNTNTEFTARTAGSFQKWDQRLSITCYALSVSIISTIGGLFGRQNRQPQCAPFQPPRYTVQEIRAKAPRGKGSVSGPDYDMMDWSTRVRLRDPVDRKSVV